MNWTTIWSQAAAPSFAMGMLQGKKKTVVFPVSSPVSGERVRLRFSNIYGKKPYVIGAVTVRGKGQPVPGKLWLTPEIIRRTKLCRK